MIRMGWRDEEMGKYLVKIDWFKVVLRIWGAFGGYVLIPLLVWVITLEQNLNIPIDGNTFWAVMAVLLIIRIIRILVHPPTKLVPVPLEELKK